MTTRHHRRAMALLAAGILAATGATALDPTAAAAALPGADPHLTRAPYLTDVTAVSVQITWATDTQGRGAVDFGPPGTCAGSTVSSTKMGNPITINGVREFQNSVQIAGLAPGTAYCYRVFTGTVPRSDLLGTNPSPQFTTLDPPGSHAPRTFAVFGDWGSTTNSGVNDGSLNVNQAGVLAQVAASGARFALSTGDVAYPGGNQTNYGDLNQTGVDIGTVFGPSYWAQAGQRVPMFAVTGNHGRTATFATVWPEPSTVASSGGVYGMVNYPSFNGTTATAYPTSYYAFTSGGIRFYILDASWADNNLGNSTGGACGAPCRSYELDYGQHWQQASAQYQWLAHDLATHPGGLKMAVFHYPLRSDDTTEPGDSYLTNVPGNPNSLEQLLRDGGVKLVFNGHAHIYQRNIAPPGGVISYVTGGGGGRVIAVGGFGCATTDAYALGWSYSKNKGSKCGAASAATSDAQVYNLLKVQVNGTQVTVTPIDAQGHAFDVMTYDFRSDSAAPTAPAGLTATVSSPTKVVLHWSPGSDDVGVSAYDIYRDTTYLATVTPGVSTFADTTVDATKGHVYQVGARDLAGNIGFANATINGGTPALSSLLQPAVVAASVVHLPR